MQKGFFAEGLNENQRISVLVYLKSGDHFLTLISPSRFQTWQKAGKSHPSARLLRMPMW